MRYIRPYAAVVALAAGALAATVPAASAGEFAYVPLGSENRLEIVDIAKGAVIGRIDGLPAVHGLAGTPDGRLLIAGSYQGRKAEAAAPAKPSSMSDEEHSAHHKRPPAAAHRPSSEISTLSIVRTADRSVIRRIDVPGAVHHVAASPDGRFAVVTHPAEDRISAVDLESYEVVANLATGSFPNYAAFSPDGSLVYVSNAGNGTVSAVDTEHWIVRWNIVVGTAPEHLVLSEDGAKLYVNNVDDGTVSVVDTAARKAVGTVPVGSTPHGIDISDDGKTLFVSALGDDRLAAVDLETGRSRNLALKPEPYHVAAIRGAGTVYVSSAGEAKIWIVDQKTLQVVGEVPIGGKGHQIVQAAGS